MYEFKSGRQQADRKEQALFLKKNKWRTSINAKYAYARYEVKTTQLVSS